MARSSRNKNKNRELMSSTDLFLFGRQAPELISEAYKEIRTNILYLPIDRKCKRIAITSANAREGKTITSINVAMSLAQLNNKVLLIDADLRASMVQQYLMMSERHGLSEFLAGIDKEPKICHYPENNPEVDIILTGKIPPNPSELLLSLQMEQLMKAMENYYDYIIIDTPPINVVTDATTLIDFVDSYLIVVRSDHSRIDNIRDAIDKMEMLNANIGGFILNDINVYNSRYSRYYGKYYSHYYGSYRGYGGYGYGGYGYGGYGYGRGYGRYGRYGHYGHYGKPAEKPEKTEKPDK